MLDQSIEKIGRGDRRFAYLIIMPWGVVEIIFGILGCMYLNPALFLNLTGSILLIIVGGVFIGWGYLQVTITRDKQQEEILRRKMEQDFEEFNRLMKEQEGFVEGDGI
jgi:hypothetical protein